MAKIIGCITTSHVPAIGRAIAKGLQEEPYWKPFFDGFRRCTAGWPKSKPDVAVVVYNDHGLNFFLDKMPTFAIGAAPEYRNADEGWGIPTVLPFRGDPELSWHLINPGRRGVRPDHVPGDGGRPCASRCRWRCCGRAAANGRCASCRSRSTPSCSRCRRRERCYKLGQAIGRAVESYPEDLKVVVIGTGGLSHQLDGERAGFINKDFDRKFMASLIDDPTWAARFSTVELVEQTGSQGIELVLWLAARATLGAVREVTANYHMPISNTAAGMMLLEAA